MNRRYLMGMVSAGFAGALLSAHSQAAPRLPAPRWILPVDIAREVANRERKPLMIISLNGNLDGNC